MSSGETEGLVGITETVLPGSMPSPSKAKELYAPDSPGKLGVQPPQTNWVMDTDAWLSSTKLSQEWCPVGRTLDVDNTSGTKIVGCSIDAHTALVATSNGGLRLWDLEAGSCIKTLDEPEPANVRRTRACHFFNGGKQAAACGLGVHVWDVATGQMRTLPEYQQDVNCCHGSFDGSKVLFGSPDGTVNVWNLDSTAAKPMDTYKGHDGAVNDCVFFDNGRKVLSCSVDRTVRAWDLADPDGALVLQGHGDTVLGCDACPDGERAVSCSGDRTVKLWNIKPSKQERELLAELNATTNELKKRELNLKLNAIRKERCLKTFPFPHAKPTACRVFPDGLRMLVITDNPQIYSLDTFECTQSLFGHAATINACCLYDGGAKAVTCSTTIRVWDLSSRGKPHQLGMNSNMHTSVVKELRMSPDGLRLLSCAYDDSLRIWDLNTGDAITTITDTHKGQVFDCSWFPDQEQVLSCGGDKTLKIWSTRTGNLAKTLEGHKKLVRGCWVFDDGKQVLSCSADSTLMVWDVASGQSTKALLGHKDLVDRCSVFVKNGITYGMSASWDNTLRLWDIDEGKPLGVMREPNKARGFALYKDNTRAVCTGSGLCLSIWNVDDVTDPSLITRLETGHTATVWGLEMLFEKPSEPVRCLTFSQDGTLRVWNLTEDAEREEVSGRRAFDPGPMCAAAIPAVGHYALGNAPIVVGLSKKKVGTKELGEIKLVDLSNLGSGPSSSALALALSCVSIDVWTQWLLAAMDEDEKANVLFLRDEGSELPTLVHKLAARSDGAVVLKRICKDFANDAAVGFVSHAGSSPKGNALEIAISNQFEDTANVLLDDYSRHVDEAKYDLTENHLLSESDVVRLFEAFPGVATKFLMAVALCNKPNLLQQGSRCDFAAHNSAELVCDHASSAPAPKSSNGTKWWDKKLDKMWEQSGPSHASTRAEDTAYGERAEAKMIPFVCAKTRDSAQKASRSSHVNSIKSESSRRHDLLAQTALPFSRLLGKASDHADAAGPAIFESKVLAIVVQLKWEESCRFMHMTQFYAYCIFILLYACCTLLYGSALASNNQDTLTIVWISWGGSTLYALLLLKREIHQVVGAWRNSDSTNICGRILDTMKGYFNLWNIMDIVNLVFGLGSLVMMAVGVRSHQAGELVDFHSIRNAQALAGFGAGFKVLYFLRGMDFASFLINMLENIIYDMKDFLVVLMVILVMYMYVFQMLLNAPSGPNVDDPLPASGDNEMGFPLAPMTFDHAPYNSSDFRSGLSFEEGFMSFIAVHNMMYGDFDMSHFDNYHGVRSWVLTLLMFVGFMLMVPTIMFNALIAIMGDTYGRVNDQKEAAGLHERAKLILELETLMFYYDVDAHSTSYKQMSLAKKTLCVLASWRIPYSTNHAYIHVLAQETVALEDEDVTLQRIAKIDEQMGKLQEHVSMVDQKLTEQSVMMAQILARLEPAGK